MNKNNTLIIILVTIILLMSLVYLAYIIDTNKIATFADQQSEVSAQDLTRLPSPDESIISKIYTTILKPFIR
jgi:hypothetical protein